MLLTHHHRGTPKLKVMGIPITNSYGKSKNDFSL